jgi:hypothetical protein
MKELHSEKLHHKLEHINLGEISEVYVLFPKTDVFCLVTQKQKSVESYGYKSNYRVRFNPKSGAVSKKNIKKWRYTRPKSFL